MIRHSHIWHDTGRKNCGGQALWKCSRTTCGHYLYGFEQPPATACGDDAELLERSQAEGCLGCGQHSNSAQLPSIEVPADYPGMAVEE